MAKSLDAIQEFLDGRPKLKSALEAIEEAERKPLLEELGAGFLRQSDYSRKMDEVKKESEAEKAANATHKAQLDIWFAHNEPKLKQATIDAQRAQELEAEVERLKSGGAAPEVTAASLKLDQFAKKDDLQAAIRNEVQKAAGIQFEATSALVRLAGEHSMKFKEVLDPVTLRAHAVKTGKLDIAEAYKDLFADKLKKFDEDAEKQKEADLEARVREKIMKETGGRMPYPMPTDEPGVLSGLAADKDARSGFGVKAALDEFYRSQKPS